MNTQKAINKDLYYTSDHEWIDFQGTVAYTGICSFKLLGFKEIQEILFAETMGSIQRGEIIARIKYNDYQIEAHMPVDGKLVQVNEALLSGNQNILLQYPEGSGWIAMIIPSQPYERKELLLPGQYQLKSNSKYFK